VLEDVDFAVLPGQVYALLGPNGAGKSTTLKVASGQLKPTHGRVLMHGQDVTGRAADERARAGLCLVPEDAGSSRTSRCSKTFALATFSGTPFRQVLDRAFERFPRLGERRKQVAGTLSGGEQQMLSMARALAIDPKVLLSTSSRWGSRH